MGKPDKYAEIYKRAAESRIFLGIHGFLTEKENEKIRIRINKYREAMNKADPKNKIPA